MAENVSENVRSKGWELVEVYETIGDAALAEAVVAATDVPTTAQNVRDWVRRVRGGDDLPKWVRPQVPAIVRVAQAIGRAKRG